MGFCLWGVFLCPWWRFCYSCPFQGPVVQSVPTLGKFLVFPNPWCKILQILCAILSKFARRIVSTCRKWCVLSNFARKNGTSSDQLVHFGAKIVKSCQNYGPLLTIPNNRRFCILNTLTQPNTPCVFYFTSIKKTIFFPCIVNCWCVLACIS